MDSPARWPILSGMRQQSPAPVGDREQHGKEELTGWGLYPRVRGVELRSEDREQITRRATLSRGLGRAYGDAALPTGAGQTRWGRSTTAKQWSGLIGGASPVRIDS